VAQNSGGSVANQTSVELPFLHGQISDRFARIYGDSICFSRDYVGAKNIQRCYFGRPECLRRPLNHDYFHLSNLIRGNSQMEGRRITRIRDTGQILCASVPCLSCTPV
jgi:hypothetical protein